MSAEHSSKKELMKAVLKPLLDDFIYWFEKSISLLESEQLSFITPPQQKDLLNRLKIAKQEVISAQMLFNATEGEAGIDTQILLPWHQLVAECWSIAQKRRSLSSSD